MAGHAGFIFPAGEAVLELPFSQVTLIQEIEYPWEGEVTICVHTKEPMQLTLAIRVPGWCRDPSLRVNGDEMDRASLLEKG